MTNAVAPLPKRDETRERVAANLYAELKRKRLTTRATATALGLSQAYVNRRTSGSADMSASDLEMFAEFLQIPIERFFVNDENAPDAAKGRAGASGISGIVLMDSVRRVGPAGIEPTTSTVESGKFAADWMAPVIGITRKVVGL